MMRWFSSSPRRSRRRPSFSGYFLSCRRPSGPDRLRQHASCTTSLRPKPFLSFCVNVLLAMTVVFELPLFVVGLTRLKILTTDKLRRNRRIGYFICIVIGLALAGVDP